MIKDDLKDYLKAGYPAICVLTQEAHRAEQHLMCDDWNFYVWDCIQGIRPAGKIQVLDDIKDPAEAISWLSLHNDTVLIANNLHLFLEIPEVIQAIQNGVIRWKGIGCALIMVSPTITLTPEIEKYFTIIDLPLPDDNSLINLQKELCKSVNVNINKRAARAAKGLTEFEAETAFALSLIKKGYCSTQIVSEAKSQMIKKSGLMEFWEPADIKDVGGLNNLKTFISNRARSYESGNEHLPRLKGIILVGIPGTGKSLASKATASLLGWPLIRLDIGSLKSSLVGDSERRIREATAVIDAFGEVVVWIDEVEKAFAGTKSSGELDAGTTANMFSHFLTWIQESDTSAIIMATANDISKLPPEFIRAGRFDGIFFVDLPTTQERIDIIRIMNKKYGSDIPITLAQKLNGYTGAEIEQLAKDSLYDGIDAAFDALVPLSRVMRDEINTLREWAKNRARPANLPEEEPKDQRKIRQIPKVS